MEWWQLWIPFGGTIAGIFANVYINYRQTKKNEELQKEITQKQIDANLKAKARIEWISDVRELVSEYIARLSILENIMRSMIEPAELIQIERMKDEPDDNIILSEKAKLTPLNESLKEEQVKITCISENILLYFSHQEEHKNIEKIITYIPNQLIILELFMREINGEYVNKTPLNELLKDEFNEYPIMVAKNVQEIRKEFRNYLKIEWDKAKEGQ
ncbi:hypothetical protein [Enterococcus faecalis]|uniref:hypothetical protein n=1 Tax=Enterococcus faecalis TaxID=1351 RepID=UPI000B604F52|nr:hypothetical protein [Enterococcus faecalis]ASE66463.1 hypothetical protein CEQ16_12145 [Enterococcus faecalis]EGO6569061.1 hypothetical protein [Enterococcus faecalis]EGO8519048.1 hypothetical protein [Enterococcus faecalis]HAZ6595703.1 hypothetical protein [Enterococcus faecalis]